MTKEKLLSHYNTVKQKHNNLDKSITESYKNYTNDTELHKMKIEKLHLKEEMDKIEKELKEIQ